MIEIVWGLIMVFQVAAGSDAPVLSCEDTIVDKVISPDGGTTLIISHKQCPLSSIEQTYFQLSSNSTNESFTIAWAEGEWKAKAVWSKPSKLEIEVPFDPKYLSSCQSRAMGVEIDWKKR